MKLGIMNFGGYNSEYYTSVIFNDFEVTSFKAICLTRKKLLAMFLVGSGGVL